MSLNCAMTLNANSYSSGATPPPMATLTVYNPNAASVAVTGFAPQYFDVNGNILAAAIGQSMPAMGPGQTVVVPALGTLTFGPFPVVVATAANANPFQAVIRGSQPINPQLAMPTPVTVQVGGLVYGSDGSVNQVAMAPLIVASAFVPPVGQMGGSAQFNNPNNSGVLAVVI
jgi:hypothetical protein